MGELDTNDNRAKRLPRWLLPAVTICLVVAISVGLYFIGRNPAVIEALQDLSYPGAFLISLIGNATVLLPGIVLPILTGLSAVFYPATGISGPVLVGVAGGLGAALGEIVGYSAGYSGRGFVENRRIYRVLVGWVERWGGVAIFVFSLAPLFFDLVGLAAGVLRFPLWKFVLICWVGRTISYVGLIVLAVRGLEWIIPGFC